MQCAFTRFEQILALLRGFLLLLRLELQCSSGKMMFLHLHPGELCIMFGGFKILNGMESTARDHQQCYQVRSMSFIAVVNTS